MYFVRKLIWGAVGRFAWRKGREYWSQRQQAQRTQSGQVPSRQPVR
jgi:hypothetical protein